MDSLAILNFSAMKSLTFQNEKWSAKNIHAPAALAVYYWPFALAHPGSLSIVLCQL